MNPAPQKVLRGARMPEERLPSNSSGEGFMGQVARDIYGSDCKASKHVM